MKIQILTVTIFSFLVLRGTADCTTDKFCTDCSSEGVCSLCTDNSIEATRFRIYQPYGTCYAKGPNDAEHLSQYVDTVNMRICSPGCSKCSSSGVCSACEMLARRNVKFNQYVITYQGDTHCTHDCGLFPGYFSASAGCTACPANCFNCTSASLCTDCSYSIPRFNGLSNRLNSDFLKGNIGTGYITCDAAVTRSTTLAQFDYYLSPDAVTCSTTCAGTVSEPFGDINDIFVNVREESLLSDVTKSFKFEKFVSESGADIYSKSEVIVNIYLLKGTTQEHYWVFDSALPDHVIKVFNRVSAQVTIQPAIYSANGPCNDAAICYTLNSTGQLPEKPLVMWKNPYLRFYVTRSLTISNIIFDGADMVTMLNAYSYNQAAVFHPNSTTQKARFCLQANDSSSNWTLIPNPDYPQDQLCSFPTAYENRSQIPFPSEFVNEMNEGSLFNMSFLSDYTGASIPTILLEAFITMNVWGSKVTISNTIFRNFLFPSGIVTNTIHIVSKIFARAHNIHDQRSIFSCRNVNSSFGDCHSINITNSVFEGYNAQKISFSITTSATTTTAVNAFTPYAGVEAFVLRVRSLDGPITIKGSTFSKMITLKRDSQLYTSEDTTNPRYFCTASRALLSSTLPTVENVARYIRKLNYLFKQLPASLFTLNLALSLSSCFDIRDLKKGLVLYQNTFQSIYSASAPVLHLYGFENTLNYPIIIDSNIIKNNQANDYATAFYIGKTEPDYSQLGCDGIFIHNNTISQNVGCKHTAGTALVLCDTDPIRTNTPQNQSTGYSTTFTDSFYYHFTRNQNGDYHPYTQKLSTKLFNAYKNNQASTNVSVLHPFRESFAFITNGLTVTNNVFEENVAWLSTGVISQGSYRAVFDQNSFINGTVFNPDTLLGRVWSNSPVVSILQLPINPANFFEVIAGATSQSPLWIKLANQVQITNCLFDGNRGANYGNYWIGSAITLSSLIGMSSPLIKNCTFQNHIGLWNESTIALASLQGGSTFEIVAQTNSHNFDFFYTQNNAPMITVNFYGGNYEFNYTNNPSSTSEYHEDFIANATVILDSCNFINNTFNQTSWNYQSSWVTQSLYANHSFIVKGFVINETIDYVNYDSNGPSLATSFYPNYNPEGFPIQKMFLTVQNSKFTNNTVYSPQPLFANTIFDQITVVNSTFERNTIATTEDSEIMKANTAIFVLSNDNSYRLGKDYQQILIIDSQFINNSGPALFTNYTASKESESLNTMILLQNLNFFGHSSKLPIFFIEKFTSINISSLYLNKTSVKAPAMLLKDINTPFLSLDNITIDGIDNLQVQATDSSTIYEDLNSFSLCLALRNISNITVSNISCLNSNFSTNAFYSFKTIGACGHFNYVFSTTISNFTCSGATYKSDNTSMIAQQALFLIEGPPQIYSTVNFTNLTVASNNVYQGFVMENSLVDFASDIKINSNTFSYAGISSSVSCQVNLTDAQVLNNNGTVLLNYEGPLHITNSTFQNNTGLKNTIVNIYMGLLNMTNCTVVNNSATNGGALIQAGESEFSIQDSTFEDNTMSRILIYSINCGFSVVNSSFLRNQAKATTSNIEVSRGSASIINVTHEGNTDTSSSQPGWVQADFLYASQATVMLTDIKSSNSRALYGAMLFSGGSIVTVNNSQFSNGSGSYSGAIATRTSLTLSNCNFTGNQATRSSTGSASSILALEGTPSLNISNIISQDNGGYSISALSTSNVTVFSSVFQSSSSSNVAGGIEILSAKHVNLTNITITGMKAAHGGGLSVSCKASDNTQFYMNSLNISNCTAENGGAMFIDGVANISLENSILDGNIAYSTRSNKGYGGGIYYSADSEDQIFKIDSTVSFLNNYASKTGGALYYDTFKFSSIGSATFENNSATYGSDLGSFPISVGLITSPDPLLIEEYVKLVDPYFDYISEDELLVFTNTSNGRLLATSQQYTFISGEIMFPPLVFAAYDDSNGMVGSDNSSVLSVVPDPNFDWNGSYPIFLKGSSFVAYKGYYIIYPFSVSFRPNSSLSLQFVGETLTEKAEKLHTTGSTTSIILDFFSKECAIGQRITHDNICSTCPAGYFAAEVSSYEDCTHCPEGKGTCLGGNIVGPQENYWRFNSTASTFYPCKNYEACLGSIIEDPEVRKTAYCKENYNETFCLTGWCSEMYEGNLCSSCKDGYALENTIDSNCVPCVKDWWLYTRTVLFGILAILIVMALVRGAILDEDSYIKKKEAESKNPPVRRKSRSNSSRKTKSKLSLSPISPLMSMKRPEAKTASRSIIKTKSTAFREQLEAAVEKLHTKKVMLRTQIIAKPDQESQTIQKPDTSESGTLGCLSPIERIESSVAPKIDTGEKVLLRTKKKPIGGDGSSPIKIDSSATEIILDALVHNSNQENINISKLVFDSKERSMLDSKDKSVLDSKEKSVLDSRENSAQKLTEKNKFDIISSDLVQGVNAIRFSNLGGDNDNSQDEPDGLDEGENYDENQSSKQNAEEIANTGQNIETNTQVLRRTEAIEDNDEKRVALNRLNSITLSKHSSRGKASLRPEDSLPLDFKRENSKSSGTDLYRIGSKVFSRDQILDRYSKNVNMVSAYTKILINFIQMISIVHSYQLSWPQALETFFQQNVRIYLVFLQFFNLDCLMKVANISTSMPDIFKKVLFYAFLPLVLSFVGVVFWFIAFIGRIMREKTKREQIKECMYTRMVVTTIVICFFLHSSLMQITLSTLRCLNFGTETQVIRYVERDLSLECWGDEHRKWVLCVTLPCLLFWAILVPLFVLSILYKNSDKLFKYKMKSRYGWLYEGYNKDHYYWEFLISFRKTALILISVFLMDKNHAIGATVSFAVMVFSYFLQYFQNPHRRKALNRMERHSLFAVSFVIYGGLLFMEDLIPEWGRWTLFALLMLGIGVFIIYWLKWYLPAQIRYCLKNKWLQKSKFGPWLSKISTLSNANFGGDSSASSDSMSSDGENPHLSADSKVFSGSLNERQLNSIDTVTNKTEAALIQDTVYDERNQQLFKRIGQDGTVIALNKMRQLSLGFSTSGLLGDRSPSKKLTYQPTLAKIQEDGTENITFRKPNEDPKPSEAS